MNHKSILSLLVLLPALFLVPATITPAHALITGKVCIAASSSISCPASPPTFTGTTSGQLTIALNVQGSDSLAGFDIRVKTDSSVLNPVSVAVEGGVLSTYPGSQGVFWFGCINGTPTNSSIPSGCSSNVDGPGIARVIATGLGCCGTTVPTTGRLFSITYNIVNGASTTSISYPIGPAGAVGCDPSAVQGTTTCIEISNSSGQFVPETAQTANFGTAPPNFTISASPNSLTIQKDSAGQTTVTVTSLNGFTGTVTFSATVSPVVRRGPTTAVTPSSVTVTANGQAISTLTITTQGGTPFGTYTVNVTGTGNGLTRNTQVTVTVPDT